MDATGGGCKVVRQCEQKCRFFGVSGDSDVTVHQLLLHNCKGAFSRLAGVVGRCLVLEDPGVSGGQ